MSEEIKQEKTPTLTETLFDLEKHMSGEARNGLPDSGDVITSIQMVQGRMIFVTCTGIWRFHKRENGVESMISLESRL